MFDEMVVSSPNPKKTNKPWTVILSMIFQTAFLAVLILIPLIYTEALPKTMMATLLVAHRRHHHHHLLRSRKSCTSSRKCT